MCLEKASWTHVGFFLLCLGPALTLAANCDVIIKSGYDARNGTFHSPGWPNDYENKMRCIYRFLAKPDERVKIKFELFDVRGVPPRCLHDYVDVYTQVLDPTEDLLDIPLHGRYCGNFPDILPHLLISMGHAFILGFYTDGKNVDSGFSATYEFIDAGQFIVGTPATPDLCGQTVRSDVLSEGILLSPTYPGMYPDNIFCFYKLQGVRGQRIKFTFIDLNLYDGGEHCPYDFVRIYDGYTNQETVIGSYCGVHKNVSIYSTNEAMHIEFSTKSGRVNPTKKPYRTYWDLDEETIIQRRGFRAHFEISSRFVKLDFIKYGEHVRGTECDQRVLSEGESNGTITSPNYPNTYPLNTTCTYYVDGLLDKENLEKAKLVFEVFDIPTIEKRCDNGFLKAYTRGQDMTQDSEDILLCGSKQPPSITTADPRLLLIFSSNGTYAGRGFKAQYSFITDYAIGGTPASLTDSKRCHFLYRSTSHREGSYNSPRHPARYPPSVECTYEFIGLENDQVRLTFDNFAVEDHNQNCTTDYVLVYSISLARHHFEMQETLIGRFCGSLIPGPLMTEVGASIMKIVFITDVRLPGEKKDILGGFKGKYEFLETLPASKRCFYNITSKVGGLIRSPNYPHKYSIGSTCDWHIYTRLPGAKILLTLEKFELEKLEKGCARAILRVYPDTSSLPQYEFCGKRETLPTKEVLSQGGYMRIQFINSNSAIGGKGFILTWTEVLPLAPGDYCSGFVCEKKQLCIASKLRCDNHMNCGESDDSDEGEQCSNYTDHGVLHIILGVVISLVVLVFIIVCILHRRRKSRKKKNKKEIEVRYVTRGGTPNKTGPSGEKLILKEHTEKVSIV